MRLFEKIMEEIECRKRVLEAENFIKYCGYKVDITTEIANDKIINKLYNKLEKYLPLKYEYKGKFYSIIELAKKSNINKNSLRTRLVKLKWNVEKAMFTEIKEKKQAVKELSTC